MHLTPPHLADCPPDGPAMQAVLALSKRAKATVGFMPDAAFVDRAERGTLLVAEREDTVVAYVLYDLPRDEVRIRQLVTGQQVSGQGIARLLVDELQRRHPTRRGIFLECRRDFPANGMWPKLHFTPLAERPGKARLPLTTWFRDFGHPTLFTANIGPAELPVAALDANIVIDLADGVPTTSECLRAPWIANAVQLAVTEQVYVEIDRQADGEIRQRHRAAADSHAHLPVDHVTQQTLLEQVHAQIANPRRYDGDLRQAAAAAAAGARWLVTRDGRFERACASTIKVVLDLDVVSPGELLAALDAWVSDDTYRPTDVNGSSVELTRVSSGTVDDLAAAFVNQRSGETTGQLRRRLHRLLADTPGQRLYTLTDGTHALGLIAFEPGEVLTVALCRVYRGPSQSTIARQLIAIARDEGPRIDSRAVRLQDPNCGDWIRRAAADEGFLPAGPGFTALPISGSGTRKDLIAHLSAAEATLGPDATPRRRRPARPDRQRDHSHRDAVPPLAPHRSCHPKLGRVDRGTVGGRAVRHRTSPRDAVPETDRPVDATRERLLPQPGSQRRARGSRSDHLVRQGKPG